MNTEELQVLVQTVGLGSISAAARRLELSPMVASRRLAALEAQVGVQLVHRTTCSVALTSEGEAFLPFARQMLEAEQAGLAQVSSGGDRVAGLLRVTAPGAFGRKIVAPLLPPLLAAHPDLRVELDLTDSIVDIVAHGIDVAIRIATLKDSGLVAQKLAPNERLICAAPSYIAAAGQPARLADLADHDCLALGGLGHWSFDAGGHRIAVPVRGRFSSSSVEAVHAMCVEGQGLAMLSRWNVAEDLARGALVEIALADATPEMRAVWAIYPQARFRPARSRAFTAALKDALRRSTAGQRVGSPPRNAG